MMYIKDEDQKAMTSQLNKANKDYEDLKKSFDRQCDAVKADEVKRHNAIMKSERDTMELTHKATNATLTAELGQQKNEIGVLMRTIENMKEELKEQKELTKEIAKSASKSQISQTIGGK